MRRAARQRVADAAGIGAIFFHFFQFMSDLLALVPTAMHLAVMRMISDNVSSWLLLFLSSSCSTACR